MIKVLHAIDEGKPIEVEIDEALFPGQKLRLLKYDNQIGVISCEKGDCGSGSKCRLFEFRIKENKVVDIKLLPGLSMDPFSKLGSYRKGNYYICICTEVVEFAPGESISYTIDKTLKRSGPPAIGDTSKCRVDKFSVQYLGEDGKPHQLTYIYCAECGCPDWQNFGDDTQPTGKECYMWKRKLNASENDPYTLDKAGEYKIPRRLSGTSDMNCEFGCICVDELKEDLYSEKNKHTTVNGKNGVLKYYPKGAPDF